MKTTIDTNFKLTPPPSRAESRKPPAEESFEQTLESARAKPRETEKPVSRKPNAQREKAENEAPVETVESQDRVTEKQPVDDTQEPAETPAEDESVEQETPKNQTEGETSSRHDAPMPQYAASLTQDHRDFSQVVAGESVDDGEAVEATTPAMMVKTAQQQSSGKSAETAEISLDPALATEQELAPDSQPPQTSPKAIVREPDNGQNPQTQSQAAVEQQESVTPLPVEHKPSEHQDVEAVNLTAKHEVQPGAVKAPAPAAANPAPPQPPETRFAADNHPTIIAGMRGQLLPDGGKMTLKLDPPELGALEVSVQVRGGAMTATFQTSNDEATRMLSHSLGQLKQSLESQGISVDRIHVQQAPRDQQSGNNPDQKQETEQRWDNPSARQEQQRREMVQRMWRKLAGVEDPLDLVA